MLVDLYLGTQLGWVGVSEHGRQGVADSGGAVTITRPSGDSATMDLVLASPGGRYAPRNPRSDLYGLLGRNTPIRFGLEEFVATFDAPSATGWGAGWTSWGAGGTVAGGDSSVAAGQARHSVPVANAYRASHYTARRWTDCEVRLTFDTIVGNGAGAPVEPGNIMLRLQDTATYYLARVELTTAGQVAVSLFHSSGGLIAGPLVVPGSTLGQPFRVAASCVGDRLAVKVWDPAAAAEPRDWQLTATDGRITAPGYIGVRSGVAAGNTDTKPVGFWYDDLQVVDRRAHMEVSEWPPRWNPAGTDSWVPIQASGILRRLSQGRQPVLSPMRRTIAATGPVAYYPAEDGVLASAAGSAVSGQAPLVVTGSVEFSDETARTFLEQFGETLGTSTLADLAAGGSLAVTFGGDVSAATTNRWTVHTFGQFDMLYASADIVLMEWTTTGTFVRWQLVLIEATDHTQVIAYTAAGTPTVVIDRPSVAGGLIVWAVSAEQSGGTISVTYWVGSNTNTVTGSVAGTLGGVTSMTVNRSGTTSTQPMPFGHLAVWATANIPYRVGIVTDSYGGRVYAASGSYHGELAADRIARLCAEQGVPVLVSRTGDPSARMGAQPAAAFLDLLRECADADGGILGEAREQLALTYRCLTTLYNQTPLDLDYTHLAPPLEPVDDDEQVRNDVTVTRRNGSSARAIRTTGPLSVQPPPAGVGVYDTDVTLNLANDGQLADQAGWRMHLGTWDEARYPTARVLLADPQWQAAVELAGRVVAAAEGDMVQLDGLPDWLPPGPVLSMIRASVERIDEFTRSIDWTWVPGGPYTVAEADGAARVPADGSTLAAGISASATSLQITFTAENGRWTTDVADFPLDIRVGGERIRLSGITGTSSPQTATVATGGRGVNGVSRAWSAGTPVDVWLPAIAPL